MRAFRPVLILALATASLVPGIGNASHNLAPNPGFENSPTGPVGDAAKQPIIPTGWAFEGAAGLFDHSENGKHTGKRMIAISVPASTNRKICQQNTCVDSPLSIATNAADPAYSVGPFWRTALPIPVTGNKTYTLKVWVAMDLATLGAGATTKVRWVDANGVPISVSQGPRRAQASGDPELWPYFEQITGSVTAPDKAKGAILMLGAIDDLFISQIKFDDVSFTTTH